MDERPMNEAHDAMLKTALKLPAGAPLPDAVREMYWQIDRTSRRLGLRVGEYHLLLTALLANRPTPSDPESFIDYFDRGFVSVGDRVLAKFRGKWRWGTLVTVRRDEKRAHVTLDDDGEVRRMAYTSVRVPSPDEHERVTA